MIELNAIYKSFFSGTPNQLIALKNINLTVQPGDFVSIIGSNGAGKSTLLKILTGVEKADIGTVSLAGKDVSNYPEHRRARNIGRIDQDPMASTAADMTIEENLAMAYTRGHRRSLRKAVTMSRKQVFRDILADLGLGLEDRMQVPVKTLSGGQRQALALVMAAIAEPQLLLLDEHTAALDPKTAKKIMNITEQVVSSKNLTTLMITHNMEQAIKCGNRLIMMHRGEIILDIGREEKSKLTISQLIAKFNTASGTVFADDRVLLAN